MRILTFAFGLLMRVLTPPASDTLTARRRAICSGCEHAQQGACALCGCYIVHKTAVEATSCPDGRW